MHHRNFLSAIFLSIITFFCAPLVFADNTVNLVNGVMLPQPRDIHPFVLYDAQNQKFTNDNLQKKWTLMFFGFTNCPALCPTTMAQLGNAYQALTKAKVDPMPQVVFVSVDPERDTASKVHTFATTFNPHFIGLRTDDMNTLQQMTKDMSVMFTKVKVGDNNKDRDKKSTYTIDHSGDIMVLNPKGQLVALLTMPHQAKSIVADYQLILKAS